MIFLGTEIHLTYIDHDFFPQQCFPHGLQWTCLCREAQHMWKHSEEQEWLGATNSALRSLVLAYTLVLGWRLPNNHTICILPEHIREGCSLPCRLSSFQCLHKGSTSLLRAWASTSASTVWAEVQLIICSKAAGSLLWPIAVGRSSVCCLSSKQAVFLAR